MENIFLDKINSEYKQKIINITVIGHVDCGKSTLCGQILYQSGIVSSEEICKLKLLAREKKMDSWYLAYLTDTTNEEREKGKTIEYSINTFNINDLKVNLIDSPGHKNYIQNTIQALSISDIAILVISAKEGEFESGFEKLGQTKEHLLIAKGCGINNIIVTINKLDTFTTIELKDRVEYIKQKLNDYVKKININIISYVEISALNNINISLKVNSISKENLLKNVYKNIPDEIIHNYSTDLFDLLNSNLLKNEQLNNKQLNDEQLNDDNSLFYQIYNSQKYIKKSENDNIEMTVIEKFQNINNFMMVKNISKNIDKNVIFYNNDNIIEFSEMFNKNMEKIDIGIENDIIIIKIKEKDYNNITIGDLISNKIQKPFNKIKAKIKIIDKIDNIPIISKGYNFFIDTNLKSINSTIDLIYNKQFLKIGDVCNVDILLQEYINKNCKYLIMRNNGKIIGIGIIEN